MTTIHEASRVRITKDERSGFVRRLAVEKDPSAAASVTPDVPVTGPWMQARGGLLELIARVARGLGEALTPESRPALQPVTVRAQSQAISSPIRPPRWF